MNKNFRSFFVVILLLSLSAIHLTLHNQNINSSYRIVKLQKQLDALRDSNRFLNFKAAKKGSLDRIEKLAAGKLGMVYPKEVKYLKDAPATREADQ